MCGIVLDVTVKFNPSTDAVQVTRGRRSLTELIPPRHVPINDSYNPLKWFIGMFVCLCVSVCVCVYACARLYLHIQTTKKQNLCLLTLPSHTLTNTHTYTHMYIEGPGAAGGALSYAPYNSAPEQGPKLDANKIDHYHEHDRIWSNAVHPLPEGTQPKQGREGGFLYGSQMEPYFDKDAFYPADYATLVLGSRVPHIVFGRVLCVCVCVCVCVYECMYVQVSK